MKNLISGALIGALALSSLASSGSPYAGQETREIKALSQQTIADYLSGKGLGYAKAAELNQFPGPRHVLDMADELDLTEQQIELSQAVFDAMQQEASGFGKQYVEREQALDEQFDSGAITPDSLKSLVSEIGALEANIRYVHLNAHLSQKTLLTQHQIKLYDQLRGYGGSFNHENHSHSH